MFWADFLKASPPNKNTGGLDPEGARLDVHRSDGVMWKFKQIQPPVGSPYRKYPLL